VHLKAVSAEHSALLDGLDIGKIMGRCAPFPISVQTSSVNSRPAPGTIFSMVIGMVISIVIILVVRIAIDMKIGMVIYSVISLVTESMIDMTISLMIDMMIMMVK